MPTPASISGCSGLEFLVGWTGVDELLAVVEAAFTFGSAAFFVDDDFELALDFFAVDAAFVVPTESFLTLSGWLIMLASLAVGVVVQYHLPLASAQLCPSGALG